MDQRIPTREDWDGRRLSEHPFVRGDHQAWAADNAKRLAREMVDLVRRGVDAGDTAMPCAKP